jgi:NADH dehydrogenase
MNVLVLGGGGFIGRHAVAALLARQHHAIIGSRRPQRVDRRLMPAALGCERREVRFEHMAAHEAWRDCLRGVDAVINCVGILRERGAETYAAVHLQAPVALAQACRARGIPLVHVSALGLEHPHRSRFLRSKRRAERLIAASGADYRLVRPSLLDGDGGYGARWIRRLAGWPLHVLPRRAAGRIAAFDVAELGEALARLVEWPIAADAPATQREFELGGLQPRDLGDYMQAIRLGRGTGRARRVPVPAWLARLGSHVCDLLHFSPFSFGHWELLQHDNMPARNRLPELLGRAPRAIGAIVTSAPTPSPSEEPSRAPSCGEEAAH